MRPAVSATIRAAQSPTRRPGRRAPPKACRAPPPSRAPQGPSPSWSGLLLLPTGRRIRSHRAGPRRRAQRTQRPPRRRAAGVPRAVWMRRGISAIHDGDRDDRRSTSGPSSTNRAHAARARRPVLCGVRARLRDCSARVRERRRPAPLLLSRERPAARACSVRVGCRGDRRRRCAAGSCARPQRRRSSSCGSGRATAFRGRAVGSTAFRKGIGSRARTSDLAPACCISAREYSRRRALLLRAPACQRYDCTTRYFEHKRRSDRHEPHFAHSTERHDGPRRPGVRSVVCRGRGGIRADGVGASRRRRDAVSLIRPEDLRRMSRRKDRTVTWFSSRSGSFRLDDEVIALARAHPARGRRGERRCLA